MLAEQLTEAVCDHAEGPVWHSDWGGLRWLDLLAGDIMSLGGDGEIARRHVGSVVAAVRPRRGGGSVIALERCFALEAPDGTLTTLAPVWPGGKLRFNDGTCDPRGRFFCGSMAYDEAVGAGSLYQLTPDGQVFVALSGLTISNGLEWSLDGDTVYYVDTGTHRIDIFDDDPDEGLVNRRPFVEIPVDAGSPDGLALDAEGGVWVALFGGGALRRYGPDGALEGIVEVDATRPTACTFGGPNLTTLYVTTSTKGGTEVEDKSAGALFCCEPGVSGVPARTFAG